MRTFWVFATIGVFIAVLWGGFNYALWGRFTGAPTTKDFEAIAREGQPLAQAISDYRSARGLLPPAATDLVPTYLLRWPKGWSYDGTELEHSSGLPHTHVAFWFDDPQQQWHLVGEYAQNRKINVSGPVVKKSSVSEEALFASRLAEFEKRINAKPREIYPYRDKANFALFSGSNQTAIAECERAAKLFTNWWWPQMAVAELRTNDLQAEENFKLWVNKHPTFINYWYLSRFYRDKDNNDAAFAALDQASESIFVSEADEIEDLKRQIQFYAKGGKAKPAQETDEDAFLSPEGFALAAVKFCYENRNYELALKIIQHCNQTPSSGAGPGAELMAFQASAELSLGQFNSAIDDAEKAAALGGPQLDWVRKLPQFLDEANAHNTNFWSQAGDYENSDWGLFEKPRELSSGNEDTVENAYLRPFQNEGDGNYDAAITDCTTLIQLSPRFTEGYNLRAWCEFLEENFDASIKDATRAIQLNLNYGNAYGTRGWARYGKGDSAGALGDLKTAVEISGVTSLEAIEDQGLIEFINGHQENAISYWQKAIQGHPSTQRALQPWIEKARQQASK